MSLTTLRDGNKLIIDCGDDTEQCDLIEKQLLKSMKYLQDKGVL